MRAIPLTGLIIFALLTSATRGYSGDFPQKVLRLPRGRVAAAQAVPIAQPRAAEKTPPLTVIGWGETHEDAEKNALRRAQDKLLVYFAEHNHSLQWRPSLDYINNNLVKERDSEPTQNFGDGVGDLQGVSLRLEISPRDWQYMLREDRRVCAESRMMLLGRLLAGLVASLGAVAGYLRLEEMTKGYYTAWLRLGAMGFVTAVGAGIWWIA